MWVIHYDRDLDPELNTLGAFLALPATIPLLIGRLVYRLSFDVKEKSRGEKNDR